jgi:hypothetical protein
MDAKHWGLTIVAVVLMGAAIILGSALVSAQQDQARLAATLDAQKTVIAAAERREQDRAEQLRDTLQQIESLKRAVQTPQQVIREIPQYLPQLPVPIHVEQPPAEPGKPAPPPVVTIPPQDLKTLYDFSADCAACKAENATLRGNLADAQVRTEALTKERDAAVKAAKGGGFWQRAGRAAKWLVIGVVAGYAAHR